MKVVIALAALCAVASASQYGYERATYDAPAVYNFAWGVDDAESYVHTSHRESRNGDNTEGEYTIVDPDGSTRTVTYYVNGDGGFVADVNGVRWPQEGPAATTGYSQPAPRAYHAPAPAYHAPTPKVYKPAPVYRAPAPKFYKPAPVVYKPAPAVYAAPAPKVYKPAPVVYKAPAPKPVYRATAPAPAHVMMRADGSSSEETMRAVSAGHGASTVSIQTPSHSLSY